MNEVNCIKCNAEFESKVYIRRTFLGFRKTLCPKCGEKIILPLTSVYRGIYWFLLVIGVLFWVMATLLRGEVFIPIPGLLGIATAVALWKDWKLRNSTKTKLEIKNTILILVLVVFLIIVGPFLYISYEDNKQTTEYCREAYVSLAKSGTKVNVSFIDECGSEIKKLGGFEAFRKAVEARK